MLFYMKRSILIGGIQFDYEVKRHVQARRTKITIHPGGRVVVTLPVRTREEYADRFVREKGEWIIKNVTKMMDVPTHHFPTDKKNYKEHKRLALELVTERVEYFSKLYRFPYRELKIRDQKTLWGSCSRKGDLSFNYRIVFLTPDLVDYLIVHEVCHLKEFNHSPRFWKLVEMTIANYKVLRKELKRQGIGAY